MEALWRARDGEVADICPGLGLLAAGHGRRGATAVCRGAEDPQSHGPGRFQPEPSQQAGERPRPLHDVAGGFGFWGAFDQQEGVAPPSSSPSPRIIPAANMPPAPGTPPNGCRKPCRVLRVSECSAVVAVTKQPREFTTLFGVRVRIQPKPGLVRISPQSEVPILNR